MPVSRTYRCLNCMEGTVTRSYDVSHLTRTCDACGEFERHVNQRVVDQYEAFEADPPTVLDWSDLDRERKLVVAERVARHGRTVESLAGSKDAEATEEAADTRADAADEASEEDTSTRTPADAALAGGSADTTGHGDDEGDTDADADEQPADTGADADRDPDAPDGAPAEESNGPADETTEGEAEESDGRTGHDSTPSGSD